MPETGSGKTSSAQLIVVPALITLAITFLRLEGELHSWGSRGLAVRQAEAAP